MGHPPEDLCIVEGTAAAGAVIYVGGAALFAGTVAVLSTPSAQRSLSTFTSAAGDSISNSVNSIKGLFFSKDAEAGQLQAAGRDATNKANAAIEKASQDIASYKNRDDVEKHIDKLKEGVARVGDLSRQLDKTKGKTERDKIKAELKAEIKDVNGHEKDLSEKPKNKKKDEQPTNSN